MKQLCCELKTFILCKVCDAKICSYCIPNKSDIDEGPFFRFHPFVVGMPTVCRIKKVNLVGSWREDGVFEIRETQQI